ncbi:MAG: leucine-rich repeat domain-containing protein [Bacteroidales bacterium]|nr:leucine-rich repeat domain-containing protein [Bacteroidales bacterium]
MIRNLLIAAAAAATLSVSAAPAQLPVQKTIPSGYTITPGQGAVVTKLETIAVEKRNEYYLEPYVVNRYVLVNDEKIAITQKANSQGNMITMVLATPVEKSGSYTVVIPKATFTYSMNETDNPEISWTLTIDNPDFPETPDLPDINAVATPATGSTVEALGSFSVAFEGADALTLSDETASKISVASMGVPVECVFTATAGDGATLEVTLEPGLILSGDYTVTLAEDAVTLKSGDNEFDSPEVKINYTVKAPLVAGDRFVVDKIRYKVLSADDKTAATTFPADEADYAGLTAVPSSVTYEDVTYTVTEIGDLTFSEVSGIQTIAIPETVTRIGEGAFWDSTITSIEIPASVTEIGESAFESCKQLKEFTLPATVTTLGTDVLYDCAQLEILNLPDNLTEIPARFAQGCVMLKHIDLPAGLTAIREFAFSECDQLADVVLPENINTLERFAFAKDLSITSMALPESITTMGHGVFYETGLTEASLPAAITVIPDGTFQCCTNLKEFTVGNDVTEIEQEAFFWCFGLEKITFGEKLATIGSKCFTLDNAIAQIECLNPVPATGAVFEQDVYDNCLLVVPDDALEAYKAAEGWKEFKTILTQSQLGVGAVEAAEAYSIAGRTVTLNIDGSIYDAAGTRVFSGKGSVELPAGVYVISCASRTSKIML